MESLTEVWHEYRLYVGIAASLLLLLLRLSQQRATSKVLQPKIAAPPTQHTETIPKTYEPTDISKSFSSSKPASGPKRVVRRKANVPTKKQSAGVLQESLTPQTIQPLVFFSTLSGTTEKYAQDVCKAFTSYSTSQSAIKLATPELLDLSEVELDDYFTTAPNRGNNSFLYLILLPSYDIDTNLSNFIEHLQEVHYDFRVDTSPLTSLVGYSIFGLGDRTHWPNENEGFCFQAKEVDKWMAKLTGRKRLYPVGMGDAKVDIVERLQEWMDGVKAALTDLSTNGTLGEGVRGSGDAVESDDEDSDREDDTEKIAKSSKTNTSLTDVEALGSLITTTSATQDNNNDPSNQLIAIDFTTYKSTKKPEPPKAAPKEMVPKSSPTYAALTKQGYTIVGSHSGVKICRWTKSALRGRGSCYKFSFYGIRSHLCMETTPSLSCSNKCVFCWRHGTNPVGTTWRWQVDPPDEIFRGVKEGHYKKIKMMRGVPGVRAERFEEAMRIRHCALSLVGEPIFYPHINEFTAMLHAERISSFLVCNAQHPEQLATLRPVTQLYVSIDASNRDSLRKIDRPLHRDFWERFNRCLDILRDRRFVQRTVYRLTLVKGFNVEDEAEGYAALVQQGLPCFVEVKGVTYCGTSTSAGAGLTMQNVPFYDEVCAFVIALDAALRRRGLGYGIAAEHAHSCCILLASDRFRVDGTWHTTINYERFFDLLESGEPFRPEDYMAPTEEWALWGNGGFNPADVKVDRKGRVKE